MAAKEVKFGTDARDKILKGLPRNVKPDISRFKGLGEMPASDLKETTLDKRQRRALRVTIEDALEAETVISQLMGKDPQSRYEFIMERARQADAAGQRAGVDARQPDLAQLCQPFREIAFGAEIARRGHLFAHHAANRTFDMAFKVFGVDPDIADMGKGEGDDLRGIARIGHHFFIAGHRGVEADLAHRFAHRAKAAAPGHMAIGKHEDSGCARGLRRKRRGGVGHVGRSV